MASKTDSLGPNPPSIHPPFSAKEEIPDIWTNRTSSATDGVLHSSRHEIASSDALKNHQFTKESRQVQLKEFQNVIVKKIEEKEELTKKEKQTRASLKSTVIFGGFLFAAGFLTISLAGLLSMVFLPPLGAVIIGGFVCPIAGIAIMMATSWKIAKAIPDLDKKELAQEQKLLADFKKCNEHFTSNNGNGDGFAQFLMEFPGPYRLSNISLYDKVFEKRKETQSKVHKLDELKANFAEKGQQIKNIEEYGIRGAIDFLGVDIEVHRESIQANEEKIKNVSAKLGEIKNHIANKEREVLRKQTTLDQLPVAAARQDRKALIEERSMAINEKNELEKQRELCEIQLKQAQGLIDLSNTAIPLITAEIQQLEKETDTKKIIDALKKEQDIVQQEIQSLEDELPLLKAETSNLESKLLQEQEDKPKKQRAQIDPPGLAEWKQKPIPSPPAANKWVINLAAKDSIVAFGDEEQCDGTDAALQASLADNGRSPHYKFLSNLYLHKDPDLLFIDGEKYKSVEHYLQTQRAIQHNRNDIKDAIMAEESPQNARALATAYLASFPLNNADDLLKKALFAKFVISGTERPSPEGIELMRTGTKHLIAGSRIDNDPAYPQGGDQTLGVVFSKDYTSAEGLNKLGLFLEELRAWLIAKNPPK